jgi:hypothetical protein
MPSKPKITLEVAGRDTSVPWRDPKEPMPTMYRVVSLTNCMAPQVDSLVSHASVHDLLTEGRHEIVIRQSKDRR